jgi:hypothetical protein
MGFLPMPRQFHRILLRFQALLYEARDRCAIFCHKSLHSLFRQG